MLHIEEDDTETKLALLASVFPNDSVEMLLEKLIENDGFVENILNTRLKTSSQKKSEFLKKKKQIKIDEFMEKYERKRNCILSDERIIPNTLWPIKMQYDDSVERIKRLIMNVHHLYLPDQIGIIIGNIYLFNDYS